MNKDLKAIVLDYDGVVVESVGIKDRAFEILFRDEPKHLPEILEYHHTHNAVIRYEKFRHIYEGILKKPFPPSVRADLSRRFSEIVVKEIIASPGVKGAKEFLESYFGRVPLYLASINPEDELKHIMRNRGEEKYFKKVYAYPWLKKDALRKILKAENAKSEEAVFIGDSPEDYEAARETGVTFIGRQSNKFFNGASIPVFKDFFEISRHLEPFLK
ncbi:MAG: HAD hydrolase-like protein [Candidatus Omnitrophota bacterium]|nr:HAD hydrolase-like protein [Candidatus Omnitrophota bacterium]MDZ4243111.1 HAD hydrolase-like protein [Candidatus Omnitrophota bacterium]